MQTESKMDWNFHYLWAVLKYCEGNQRTVCYLTFCWEITHSKTWCLPTAAIYLGCNSVSRRLGWTQLGVCWLQLGSLTCWVICCQHGGSASGSWWDVGWGPGLQALCLSSASRPAWACSHNRLGVPGAWEQPQQDPLRPGLRTHTSSLLPPAVGDSTGGKTDSTSLDGRSCRALPSFFSLSQRHFTWFFPLRKFLLIIKCT